MTGSAEMCGTDLKKIRLLAISREQKSVAIWFGLVCHSRSHPVERWRRSWLGPHTGASPTGATLAAPTHTTPRRTWPRPPRDKFRQPDNDDKTAPTTKSISSFHSTWYQSGSWIIDRIGPHKIWTIRRRITTSRIRGI